MIGLTITVVCKNRTYWLLDPFTRILLVDSHNKAIGQVVPSLGRRSYSFESVALLKSKSPGLEASDPFLVQSALHKPDGLGSKH